MRIFLVGMPGSGKSTLASQIAQHYNLKKIDLDDEIVKISQSSIESIFSERGEEYFRQIERQALVEVLNIENAIVATGGGAPCFFDNMEKMNDSGITVFLDVPVTELVERVKAQKNNVRPMAKNKSKKELEIFLSDKVKERHSLYSKAKIKVAGGNITAEEIIQKIEKILIS